MDITILGSGGNTPIPMPTCQCRVCKEAREKGAPYSRAGNSTFIHDENILIDTPEGIWQSLNRENIQEIDYIFISHFHYDHILGLRVLQPIGIAEHPIEEWAGDLPTVVMSQNTYDRINGEDGLISHLIENWSNLKILNDGESMDFGGAEVKSIGAEIHPGEKKEIFSYLIEKDGKKVMISPDENKFLDLSRIPDLDLWIRETGKFKEDAEGNPIMTEEAWERDNELEITFQETLEQIEKVNPDKTVLTEIEEIYRHSYEDLKEIEDKLSDLNIEFAYDGMKIKI